MRPKKDQRSTATNRKEGTRRDRLIATVLLPALVSLVVSISVAGFDHHLTVQEQELEQRLVLLDEVQKFYEELYGYDKEPGRRFGVLGPEQSPFSLWIPVEKWELMTKRFRALRIRGRHVYSLGLDSKFAAIEAEINHGVPIFTLRTDSVKGEVKVTQLGFGSINKTHEETRKIAGLFERLLNAMQQEADAPDRGMLPPIESPWLQGDTSSWVTRIQ